MKAERRLAFAFGPFQLFPTERQLRADGQTVRIGGRAFDLLTRLAHEAGEVVSSRVLMDEVWPRLSVEESSLRAHIRALRQTLGEHDPGREYVANIPGRGYCLVAPVEPIGPQDTPHGPNVDVPVRTTAIIGRSASLASSRNGGSSRSPGPQGSERPRWRSPSRKRCG